MSWKILVSAPYMQPVPDKYRKILEEAGCELIVREVRERLSEDELLEIIADFDGVISGDDEFTERVFKAAKKLRVVSKWGTGIDSIDCEAARANGVAVRNTLNAFTEPVADTVMGYILCFARRLLWMSEDMRAGGWTKLPGRALNETTLGIIGVGNIGSAVAVRAKPFGMRLLGNDIKALPEEFIRSSNITMVTKDELLREADFISINCDLNPTSHHLMSKEEFSVIKKGALLINTARGPLVDEAALIDALESGRLGGVALDVYEDEPLAKDSPLRVMNNVMCAPHNSNSSPRAWERVHESTVNNLLEELKGELRKEGV
jgi:phosphoglycerate dehydrogenase-like enzyme